MCVNGLLSPAVGHRSSLFLWLFVQSSPFLFLSTLTHFPHRWLLSAYLWSHEKDRRLPFTLLPQQISNYTEEPEITRGGTHRHLQNNRKMEWKITGPDPLNSNKTLIPLKVGGLPCSVGPFTTQVYCNNCRSTLQFTVSLCFDSLVVYQLSLHRLRTVSLLLFHYLVYYITFVCHPTLGFVR